MADVLVYIETIDSVVSPLSYELLGAARHLSQSLGGQVEALILGSDVESQVSSLAAADRILTVEHGELAPYVPEAHVKALTEVVASRGPQVVLVGNTSVGMDLAAALASRTGRPLVAYCIDLSIDGQALVARSQLYGGKVVATTRTDGPAVCSVIAGSFPGAQGRTGGGAEVVRLDPPQGLSGLRTRLLETSRLGADAVDITKADRLVSVGRGIGGPDNIELAQELAQVLGAELGASRPVVDSGWLPKERQVGKSGVTVKPKLYFAVGISGAPEHLEGMRDADLIVAINSDPNAPIFKVAHYGTTCDLFDLLPALSEQLKA